MKQYDNQVTLVKGKECRRGLDTGQVRRGKVRGQGRGGAGKGLSRDRLIISVTGGTDYSGGGPGETGVTAQVYVEARSDWLCG